MNRLCIVLALTVYLTACQDDEEMLNQDPDQEYTVEAVDGTLDAPFGKLDYRVYYPVEFTGITHVIHVSRGGNGLGDDRGALLPYVDAFVQNGYVVVQVDHRFAGSDVPRIAQYRGEEIQFIAQQVSDSALDYGDFGGSLDLDRQGYAGHSGGCMEGLEAAGTAMTHGDYFVPEIRAVYGMSPAGFDPDQFGIRQDPPGYAAIEKTAVFLIVGAQEKDVNGVGEFKAIDWRLQAYDAMTERGPRWQALAQGDNTDHIDIRGENEAVQAYNIGNALELFRVYVRQDTQDPSAIGTIALPPQNPIDLSSKGL